MVVTVSGVHGVGKSTLVDWLSHRFILSRGPDRPANPFHGDPVHSMLFFIAAYSARDTAVKATSSPCLLDRFSFHDIAVYIEALWRLRRIKEEEYRRLTCVNKLVLATSILPRACILLSDDVDSVLRRIRVRGGKPGHLYEDDREYLGDLIRVFEAEFSGWLVTGSTWKKTRMPAVIRIDIGGRGIDDVGREAEAKLKELQVLGSLDGENLQGD